MSSTRMTWNWLSVDAGKAAFMPPGCSLSQGGPSGVRRRSGQLVTNGGSPSVVTLGLDPRVQGDDSLFWRGVKGRKSGIHVAWMLACARMPPSVMPDPDRASRAMSPYLCDASRVIKAVFMLLDPRLRKDDMDLVVR